MRLQHPIGISCVTEKSMVIGDKGKIAIEYELEEPSCAPARAYLFLDKRDTDR